MSSDPAAQPERWTPDELRRSNEGLLDAIERLNATIERQERELADLRQIAGLDPDALLDAERERDALREVAEEQTRALAVLKDAAEPFHRLDLDLGDSVARPDEWAEVCEPLREALVTAGERLQAALSAPSTGGDE